MNHKSKGIKPYSKRELAALYEVPVRSFYTLLKPHEDYIGPKIGRYYSVLQVERIFERLGLPSCLLDDEFQIQPREGSYIKKAHNSNNKVA